MHWTAARTEAGGGGFVFMDVSIGNGLVITGFQYGGC